MEIFINSGQVLTEKWNKAEGSSLSREAHEKLNQGKIVCVDKRPCKIKLFCKCEGVLKSLIIIPSGKPLENILEQELGLIPQFEEAMCLQEK